MNICLFILCSIGAWYFGSQAWEEIMGKNHQDASVHSSQSAVGENNVQLNNIGNNSFTTYIQEQKNYFSSENKNFSLVIVPDELEFKIKDNPIRRRFTIKNQHSNSIYDVKFFIKVEGVKQESVDIGIDREGATPSQAGSEDSVIVFGYKSANYEGKIIYVRNLPLGDFGFFLTFNKTGKAKILKPEYSVIDEGVEIVDGGINTGEIIPTELKKESNATLNQMKVMFFKR